MHRLRLLVCLFVLSLGLVAVSVRHALAKDPILTILFTGNTDGHFAPCPS